MFLLLNSRSVKRLLDNFRFLSSRKMYIRFKFLILARSILLNWLKRGVHVRSFESMKILAFMQLQLANMKLQILMSTFHHSKQSSTINRHMRLQCLQCLLTIFLLIPTYYLHLLSESMTIQNRKESRRRISSEDRKNVAIACN